MRAQIELPEGWGNGQAMRTHLEQLGYAVTEWLQLGRPVYVLHGTAPADPWQAVPIDRA